MVELLSDRIAEMNVNDDIIHKEDIEIYQYGYMLLLYALGNIVTVFIIGLVLDEVLETVVFYLVFIPLRRFTGGFHFQNPVFCYFFSVAIIVVAILLSNCFYSHIIVYLLIVGVFLVIYRYVPIEVDAKPLSDNEKRVYHVISGTVFFIEIVLCIIFYKYGMIWICNITLISLICNEFLIAIEFIKHAILE